MAPLNPKQKRFAEEYLKDLNATKAAVRAGYSEKGAGTQGRRLMSTPAVRELVESLMAKRSERTAITADRVLEEIAVIAFSDLRHYAKGDVNDPVLLRDGVPDAAMRAVSSVKKKVLRGASEDSDDLELVEVEIKLWDKPKALHLAMRHLGILNDKLEVDVHGEFEKLIGEAAQEYDREIDRLAARRKAESKAR